ncbi:MAG: alanyl-tRNA editing protein [Ruminococcaceae bacterium]|nr:alanyl-tRNA editing protein [Oscillospiraceae bacterium]
MTEKLYYCDAYLTEFDCKVINLYTDEKYIYVETDRTAFFPEGGGQTSDRGWLGEAYVENVQIDGEKIIHFVENNEENVKILKNSTILHGKIDMNKRFSDMQQHSGEHIVSGIVHNLYGYNNVGFHLGSEVVTLDFDGILTNEDICKVENLVNKAIWDNLEIKVLYPTDEELSSMKYRSKIEIEGQVRIVEIPGVDVCACCAPHVKRTGEIGIVEIVNFEKYKGGTRVSILCGERALLDIRHKLTENRKISVLTKTKPSETASAVERLLKEKDKLKYELVGANRTILYAKVECTKNAERVIIFDNRLEGKLLTEFTEAVKGNAKRFVASFCGEDGAYRYCIASKSMNLQPLAKKLNEAFSGKGGGRGEMIQGSLSGTEEEIRRFLEKE